MKKICWGIIGAGRIANNFAEAFENVKNGELIAIASKNSVKLKKFVKNIKLTRTIIITHMKNYYLAKI